VYLPCQTKPEPKNERSEGQTQIHPSKKPKPNGLNKKRSPYLPTNPTCNDDCGVELVPLLARRRAQQRPVTLSTTDVTKFKSYNPNVDHPWLVRFFFCSCMSLFFFNSQQLVRTTN
jgi:hypothetical protein